MVSALRSALTAFALIIIVLFSYLDPARDSPKVAAGM